MPVVKLSDSEWEFVLEKRLALRKIDNVYVDSFIQKSLLVDDNYRHHIRAFAAFAANHSGSGILDVVRDYYRHLNSSGLAASTIRCRRQAVKDRVRRAIALPTFTDRNRAIIEDELSIIDNKIPCEPNAIHVIEEIMESDEYRKLLAGARSERQRRFIEFLSVTGCRVSEMTGVRLSDCKQESAYVAITVRGKGTRTAEYKERTVYISRGLFERVRETFGGSTYLFETQEGKRYSRSYVSNQLGKLTLAVLGRRLSAHKFRHHSVHTRINNRNTFDGVSDYVGFSTAALMQKYAYRELRVDEAISIDTLDPMR